MLILIRHAEEDETNTPSKYSHDANITKKGAELARTVAKRLIRKYGHPSVIYLSPFKRTRQTVESMNVKAKTIVDNRVSKYFTKRQSISPKIHSSTQSLSPPIAESKEQVLKRIREFVFSITSTNVVWVVTHAIILKYAAKLYERKLSHISPLRTLRMNVQLENETSKSKRKVHKH